MRRDVTPWIVAFGLLAVAFVATILALNATLYSASGFVGSYLDALDRKDATTARELPGVLAQTKGATDLLSDDAIGTIGDVRFVGDTTDAKGVHTVAVDYSIGGQPASTDFRVRQTASFLGLFQRWTFDTSPLATVAVTVLHDKRFRANGEQVTSPANQGATVDYLVFAPALYSFDLDTTFLAASPVAVPVSEPGSVNPVQVNVQATGAFVSEVTTQLKRYLDDCAKQRVLLPTSCPFGKSFDNRVIDTPKWSMVSYPRVTIIPGRIPSTWLVPDSGSAAHLTVKVQSLFDGSITTFDKDVPFTVAYSIRFLTDGGLYITVQYD